jgi:hypothetical protein
MQLRNTGVLAKKFRRMDCIIREVIEIELHPNIINREDGFSLSRSWKPLICILRNGNRLSPGRVFLLLGPLLFLLPLLSTQPLSL